MLCEILRISRSLATSSAERTLSLFLSCSVSWLTCSLSVLVTSMYFLIVSPGDSSTQRLNNFPPSCPGGDFQKRDAMRDAIKIMAMRIMKGDNANRRMKASLIIRRHLSIQEGSKLNLIILIFLPSSRRTIGSPSDSPGVGLTSFRWIRAMGRKKKDDSPGAECHAYVI